MSRSSGNAAVFLDRDGTIIVDTGYIRDPIQVRLIAGAAAGLRQMKAAGYQLVIVTNQSGIGRGYFTESEYESVHARMVELLAEEGVVLDGAYHCPIAPKSKDRTTIEHPDRKPGPGMLQQAANELNLDLSRSWMVGDSISDVLAGIHAGCRGSLLIHPDKPKLADFPEDEQHGVCADLSDAASWISQHSD